MLRHATLIQHTADLRSPTSTHAGTLRCTSPLSDSEIRSTTSLGRTEVSCILKCFYRRQRDTVHLDHLVVGSPRHTHSVHRALLPLAGLTPSRSAALSIPAASTRGAGASLRPDSARPASRSGSLKPQARAVAAWVAGLGWPLGRAWMLEAAYRSCVGRRTSVPACQHPRCLFSPNRPNRPGPHTFASDPGPSTIVALAHLGDTLKAGQRARRQLARQWLMGPARQRRLEEDAGHGRMASTARSSHLRSGSLTLTFEAAPFLFCEGCMCNVVSGPHFSGVVHPISESL